MHQSVLRLCNSHVSDVALDIAFWTLVSISLPPIEVFIPTLLNKPYSGIDEFDNRPWSVLFATTPAILPWIRTADNQGMYAGYPAWWIHLVGHTSPTIDKRLHCTWQEHEDITRTFLQRINSWGRYGVSLPSPSSSVLDSHRTVIHNGLLSPAAFSPLGAGWFVDTACMQPMSPPGDRVLPPYGIRAQYDTRFTLVYIGFYDHTGRLAKQPITPDTIRIVESRIVLYQTLILHAGVLHLMCAGQSNASLIGIPRHHPLRVLLTPFLRGVGTNIHHIRTALISSPGFLSLMLGTGVAGMAGVQTTLESLRRTQTHDIQNLLQCPRNRLRHMDARPSRARDMLQDAVRWYDHLSGFVNTFVGQHGIMETDPVVVLWKSQIGWAQTMTVAQTVTNLAYANVVHSVLDCDPTLALLTRASMSIVYGPDGSSVQPGSRVSSLMAAFVIGATQPSGYTYATLDADYRPDDRYQGNFRTLCRVLRDAESRGAFRFPELFPSVVETSVSY
jgi:hypothetical protein